MANSGVSHVPQAAGGDAMSQHGVDDPNAVPKSAPHDESAPRSEPQRHALTPEEMSFRSWDYMVKQQSHLMALQTRMFSVMQAKASIDAPHHGKNVANYPGNHDGNLAGTPNHHGDATKP
ncbi:uncharacterized protein A1O5_04524 [Cladophialophora psammophila CBS 110553]|uniref:Uncharacterized protein n=1 Tax=Cladophialophora psammophila CBS 110553 TaxID=1182543 RepID=W9X526_9EURO|nr:uncharacterized protein A1O5_04524 [Cladophialophora psammophila CBS 110553]EXJ72021.1 hypothetical protein A1O5_04524 [Cladophialophora psammophila CBS 110553]